MYNIIQHSHSGIMWLVVALLLLSVLISFIKLIKKCEEDSTKVFKLFSFTKLAVYFQFVLGVALLFLSPVINYSEGFMKDERLRFYGMEHPLMMLIAIALIAIGLFKAKRKERDIQKSKTIFIYYSIALVIVALMIPWKTVLS